MTQPLSVEAIIGDARWLAHRYDPDQDGIHFLKLERADHRVSTFINDEYLPTDRPKIVLRRDESLAAARPIAGPVHFIFHSAFCGSTLLARAFDIEGVSMGLKEPMILQDLVGWRRRGADPRRVAEMIDGSLALLSRPFVTGEATIIKPSNITSPFAGAMLGMRPKARAVLLYAPLRVYLSSIARKQLFGRLWVRELFAGLRTDGLVDLGFDDRQFFGQTDLQIAAAGWLAQKALFSRLAERFGDRVRTLNSERFIAAPHHTVAAVSNLFELGMSDKQIEAAATGPAFTRHSKTGDAFGASERVAEQQSSADIYRDEIEQVMTWATAVAESASIDMAPGQPLLG